MNSTYYSRRVIKAVQYYTVISIWAKKKRAARLQRAGFPYIIS